MTLQSQYDLRDPLSTRSTLDLPLSMLVSAAFEPLQAGVLLVPCFLWSYLLTWTLALDLDMGFHVPHTLGAPAETEGAPVETEAFNFYQHGNQEHLGG